MRTSKVIWKEELAVPGKAISLPVSKSIANRVILLNELLPLKSDVIIPPDAGDIAQMQHAIGQVQRADPDHRTHIDAGEAGTVMRFLIAMLACKPGTWQIHGRGRMHERPVRELVDMLRNMGADIAYVGKEGFPPLRISGAELRGGKIVSSSRQSSQFISALMMCGPLLTGGLDILVGDGQVSLPYVRMTAAVMRNMGVEVTWSGDQLHIGRQSGKPSLSDIEADWSSASFIYQCLALSEKNSISISNLEEESLQGDARVAHLFRMFGIRTSFRDGKAILSKEGPVADRINVDLSGCPDLVPPIAATAAGLGIPTQIRGISHLRFKESDRIAALAAGLSKLGCEVITANDSLRITGMALEDQQKLQSFGDHRIAMAMAPLALTCGSLFIDKPDVVDKSFPAYWTEIREGFGISLE